MAGVELDLLEGPRHELRLQLTHRGPHEDRQVAVAEHVEDGLHDLPGKLVRQERGPGAVPVQCRGQRTGLGEDREVLGELIGGSFPFPDDPAPLEKALNGQAENLFKY